MELIPHRRARKETKCTRTTPAEPPIVQHLLVIQTTGMLTRTRQQLPLEAKVDPDDGNVDKNQVATPAGGKGSRRGGSQ